MDSAELEQYFDLLYPINRSITGKGFTDSLDILSELIPLQKHYWKSGERTLDWEIPLEWNCCSGAIWREDNGEVIIDFKDCNLHVVGYSESVSGVKPWWDLRRFVHTIPELHFATPYVTSYYKKSFGWCMPHAQYLKLEKDDNIRYCYNIDSSLKPGKLVVGDLVVPGESKKEILLSTYLCHPSLANDGLSGPLVMAGIYNKLKELKLYHSVRYVVCPENIGCISYMSRFGKEVKKNTVAGYVLSTVGHEIKDKPYYTYKKSRNGNSLSDRAALHVLHRRGDTKVVEYFPGGSDERVYESAGYDLGVGLIMRQMYGEYPYYHSSKDDKSAVSFSAMMEMVDTYVEVVKTIDAGVKVYDAVVKCGPPMFARHGDLYHSTMRLNSFNRPSQHRRILLDLASYCDGKLALLDIAEKCGHALVDVLPVVEEMVEAKLLRETK